jgi:hypothetical protein
VQLQGRWAEWIKFFTVGVDAAVQESIATALGIEAILKRWKETVVGLGCDGSRSCIDSQV